MFFKQSQLDELSLRYETDKCVSGGQGSFKNFHYVDVYEHYFAPIRFNKLNILEIGVRDGGSLWMWEEYFPNSTIYGLDIIPEYKKFEGGRRKIFIGSQDDPNTINSMIEDSGGFDIIIDDGSHINSHIIASFNLLWPAVRKTGVYIVEDCRMTYMDLTETGINYLDKVLGVNLAPLDEIKRKKENNRDDFNKFIFEIIRQIDYQEGDAISVQFWPAQCFIFKGGTVTTNLKSVAEAKKA